MSSFYVVRLSFFGAQLLFCSFVIFVFPLSSRFSRQIFLFYYYSSKQQPFMIFRRYLSFSEIVTIALLFRYPFSINYSFLCEQNSAVLIISIQNSNLAPQGVIRYQKFLVAEKSHGNHGLHKIYNIP